MSGPRYGSRYPTSKGTWLFQRGYYNHVPLHNYPSGDGKSHTYRGAGYYIPSERRWESYAEHRSLPRETKRDAIEMKSETQFVDFLRKRDSVYPPSGISRSGRPDLHIRNPLSQLIPFKMKAWNRKWDGPGFFVPDSDCWIHEHRDRPRQSIAEALPRNAYRFHNEEDWLKFRYFAENNKIRSVRGEYIYK
ncbi:hypothetical protein BaRGS_00036468 [Batillaria attramentaria]|uniref:Uncharacterized protein n=1 Tax=Batillaria attramentaria TaxID=370345 RepID=A0ABD0JD04_9CAEN